MIKVEMRNANLSFNATLLIQSEQSNIYFWTLPLTWGILENGA